MKTTRKQNLLVVVLAGVLTLVSTAEAEQGGSGHYVSGATASFIDTAPDKPGIAALNIFLDYNDATANPSRGLPFGGNIALNVTANVYADSAVLFYTFKPQPWLLGGYYTVGATVPYVWSNIKAGGTIDLLGHQVNKTVSQNANGVGDIEFWPFMLGWTNGDFKYDTRLAIYAPSGEYNKGDLANVGLGYWTFEPEVTFSWLSSKIGTEVSVFAGMDFNTENTDANYQSGDIFHADATVAQHFPLFGGFGGVGANAFYYKQVTADSGSGARLGSFEAMSEGIGPVASYAHDFGKKQLVVEAKWLPQTQVDNTVKGSFIWVKVALLF